MSVGVADLLGGECGRAATAIFACASPGGREPALPPGRQWCAHLDLGNTSVVTRLNRVTDPLLDVLEVFLQAFNE
jgi:hypothetical protein